MSVLPCVADYITYCIRSKQPVCFLKYGDGEYQCARFYGNGRRHGHNCDGDPYTPSLSAGILHSFKYLAGQGALIGGWHTGDVCNYWQSLVPTPIQWVNYHTIIIDVKDFGTEELNKKIELFKTIHETTLPKIIVCNELLQKAALFLRADKTVYVPLRNWFDTKFGEIFTELTNFIKKSGKCVVMFAAGMSSKVLIGELHKHFPQNIYLDFGSALDLLCTRRDSRGRGYTYETLCENLAPILPAAEIWNDPAYDNIYRAAQQHLGIHL